MFAMRLEWDAGEDHLGNYRAVAAMLDLGERPPAGLLVHTAGVTEDGGFRVFEVWETREDIEAFFEGTLMPAAVALRGSTPPPPAHTEVYELERLIRT